MKKGITYCMENRSKKRIPRSIDKHLFFGNANVLHILLFCLLISIAVCGCKSSQKTDNGNLYQIYEINNEETKLVTREYSSETKDATVLISELVEQLAVVGKKLEYQAPLAGDMQVENMVLENELLTLDFDENYRQLTGTKEVLVRAAIVRTLVQVDGVQHVSFTIKGEQLMDFAGVAVGMMNADTFIDNAGDEINAYEKANLHLYFANENGDGLVEETRRNVVYNSNIQLEKLVVEQLIKGPETEGAYPVVNPDTKIVNVTVRDGVCYVNLNENFLVQPYSILSEVTIYAITNSLSEVPNINKVQLSVNGETNIMYRENTSLNTMFERNLDLLSVPN